MTWTYNVSQLGSNQMMQVRFVTGDTKQTDQQFQDEELQFALTQKPTVLGAAAFACRALAAQLARQADTVDRDLRDALSQRSRAYMLLANQLDTQAGTGAFPIAFAGGISISDKQQQENSPDRVPPQFNIGMEDNYLPVAPVGNEPAPGIIIPTDTSE